MGNKAGTYELPTKLGAMVFKTWITQIVVSCIIINPYPYPRRGRTGRPPTKKDPNTKRRLNKVMAFTIYVPRDESSGDTKMSDFLTHGLKSVSQSIQQNLNFLDREFDSFEEVRHLYETDIQLSIGILNSISDKLSGQILKEILRTDGERLLKFPTPQVIQENKSRWMTDEEFARVMLAGVSTKKQT
ncbi:hypothetical protein QN277_024064 [Acacia crassicarpa]|uniref:Lipoxygenase domain-containing protein n=1 Tax=Acacia crassicarpa TaxID=499986 RepID=A0AAE1MJ53_9FABA|nr:hypothetical protein QN277_024064 [Acacia crassicarpa]